MREVRHFHDMRRIEGNDRSKVRIHKLFFVEEAEEFEGTLEVQCGDEGEEAEIALEDTEDEEGEKMEVDEDLRV